MTTRRVWTASEKRRIVEAAIAPGANVASVARQHGIAQSLLYRWKKLAAAADGPDEGPRFVPLAIEAHTLMRSGPVAAFRPRAPGMPLNSRDGSIEVVLANGRSVRVAADIDTAALMRIVSVLEDTA